MAAQVDHGHADHGGRNLRLEELHADAAEELGLLLSRSLTYDECSVALVRAKVFDDPAAQPRYTLGLRVGDRLVATVAGVVQERQEEERSVRSGYLKVLATDPALRRQGHAARLLDELEARFAADGLDDVWIRGPGCYFWLGIDLRYSAALCLLMRRGYVHVDDALNLGVDLDGRDFSTTAEEAALAGEGISIRRLEDGERVTMDSYMQRWGQGWHDEVMQSFDHHPISCHIAQQEGHIVAFAATDIARPGWFGPMGTDEHMRGKGIGSILLRRCLVDWQRTGRKIGEIAWAGPLYFYVTAVDAWVSRVMWQMRKRLPNAGTALAQTQHGP
jgi:ribosomal protein S18 acetylase RimI-like enzyme